MDVISRLLEHFLETQAILLVRADGNGNAAIVAVSPSAVELTGLNSSALFGTMLLNRGGRQVGGILFGPNIAQACWALDSRYECWVQTLCPRKDQDEDDEETSSAEGEEGDGNFSGANNNGDSFLSSRVVCHLVPVGRCDPALFVAMLLRANRRLDGRDGLSRLGPMSLASLLLQVFDVVEAPCPVSEAIINEVRETFCICNARLPGMAITSACESSFESVTGYAWTEAIGKDFAFLLGENAQQIGASHLARCVLLRKGGTASFINRKKHGRAYDCLMCVTPLLHGSSLTEYSVVIIMDMGRADALNAKIAAPVKSKVLRAASYDF